MCMVIKTNNLITIALLSILSVTKCFILHIYSKFIQNSLKTLRYCGCIDLTFHRLCSLFSIQQHKKNCLSYLKIISNN